MLPEAFPQSFSVGIPDGHLRKGFRMISPHNFNHLSPQNKQIRDSSLASIRNVLYRLTAATDAELSNPSTHTLAFSPEYAAHLTNALLRLERILFLGAANADPHVPDFWGQLIRKQEITDQVALWIEPDRVTIRLPYLPHRYRGNQDAVAQMLAAKLHLCANFPRWEYWHADFIHLFPTACSKIPKDVDNYCYKKVIDVIAYALRTSDNAEHFDMSMTSICTDDYLPGVYVQITPANPLKRMRPSPIAQNKEVK